MAFGTSLRAAPNSRRCAANAPDLMCITHATVVHKDPALLTFRLRTV